jgi:hypothetical protein
MQHEKHHGANLSMADKISSIRNHLYKIQGALVLATTNPSPLVSHLQRLYTIGTSDLTVSMAMEIIDLELWDTTMERKMRK